MALSLAAAAAMAMTGGACRFFQRRPAEAPRPAEAAPPEPKIPPVSCRPERAQALPDEDPAQRQRRCVIDVGSRNVKLVVASNRGNDARSITGERTCRSRLQLGEKTFDQKTQAGKPLVGAELEVLGRLIADYAALCAEDHGEMLGAFATEWARRTANPDDVRAAIKARTGIDLEILSRDREAQYGYLAATRGARGKLVLDFGSRSLQLSYWPRSAAAPVTASLVLGIDEAGDRFFGRPDLHGYAAARAEYVAALRAGFGPSFGRVKSAVRSGDLSPELFSLGENGDVPLAVEGKLWNARKHHGVDEPSYAALLKARPPSATPQQGPVTAVLSAREIGRLARAIEKDRALFEELRSDRIRKIYGYKMLAFPALVGALARDMGVETVVLVPQELPDGLIVDRLHHLAAQRK